MGCNCYSDPCGCAEAPTLPYLTGDAGDDGLFGGYSLAWKFDSATNLTAPNATYLKFNNATISSVTAIKINETNKDSIVVDAFLDSFDNSGNFGLLKIFKEYDSSKFAFFELTNISDGGSHQDLTVTYIDGNGTFTTNDVLVVSFTPKGETGTNGSNAATKAYVLDAYLGNPVETAANTHNAKLTTKITIPQDTLIAEGDQVHIEVMLTNADMGLTPSPYTFRFYIDNTPVYSISALPTRLFLQGTITRVTSTQVHYEFHAQNVQNQVANSTFHKGAFQTVSNLDSNDIDLELFITNNTGQNVNLVKFLANVIIS